MIAKYKTPFLIVGALFVLWGVIGLFDIGNIPYAGYNTDGNNTVTRVREGSPAAAAGLRVGDYITSIAGVPVEDTRALAAMPRAAIGETRTLVVEDRAGVTLAAGEEGAPAREVAITYAGLPGRDVALGWAAFVIGLCFIGFGVLAYLRAPSRASTLLALTGLCLGIAFFGGPYIGSLALRQIVNSIVLALIIVGLAFLLHCLLEFPKVKAIMQRPHATKVLYAPAVLMALFTVWLIVFLPRGTSGFNTLVNALFGIIVVLYFGLALVALIHSFVKATPDERSHYGLNLMLVGVLVGLLPMIIGDLISIFAPRVILPGVDFYFLTLILIPITMALAIMGTAEAPAKAAPTPVM
jgi:hypothetical protein